MPGADTKQIYIRNPTAGFSIQGGSAAAQRNANNTVRTFNTTAGRFGSFEPGDYECTCVSETNPGGNIFGAVAIKIGDSAVTAVINVDHFPTPSFANALNVAAAGVQGFVLYAFKFRIENPNTHISLVTSFVVTTVNVVASFQKLN